MRKCVAVASALLLLISISSVCAADSPLTPYFTKPLVVHFLNKIEHVE